MSVATASPFDAAYAQLAPACGLPAVRVGRPPRGGGWVSGDLLLTDLDALRSFIDLEAVRIQAEYGARPRRHVAATWALQRYLLVAGILMSGPFLLDRRVPRLSPADIAVRLAGLNPDATAAVTVDRFACLPNDAAAADIAATVLPDTEALRAELRTTAAAHFGPVVEAFQPHTRAGRRALWRAATDQLAGGLWHLGRTLGREEQAAAEAEALLPGRTAPFGGAGFRRLPLPDGRNALTRTRLHCCLYYTLRPGETCLTCPRTSEEERLRRLAGPPETSTPE